MSLLSDNARRTLSAMSNARDQAVVMTVICMYDKGCFKLGEPESPRKRYEDLYVLLTDPSHGVGMPNEVADMWLVDLGISTQENENA